jgi:signal transduction histidine kinase
VRKDGSRFWAYVVIDPIWGAGGGLLGYAKITRDLTERKRTQEELEKTREALLQSQKQEAIGQLTGGVAHEFNKLLMAVLSSLELMRKRLPEEPRLLALLENAIAGVNRGAILVERMLAFARRQELKLLPIDVRELVSGMSDLLERSLGPATTLEMRFPPVMRPIVADANQLEMALLNLCVNARDAMPEGGKIIVGACEVDVGADQGRGLASGRYICLSVTDDGTGMDEATLARATEPFFSTKGPGKGTGLGLSMVDGLAEQSGGRFVIKSRLGEGTTAELWLPAGEKRAVQPEPEPASVEVPGEHRGLRVIVVDDDFLILTNTVAMVEDLGHTAFSAASAKEALQILRREAHVDAVVTDQAMPHMTGVQLASAIREEWPDLPVILATGYAELDTGTRSHLRKLSKPFTEAQLAAELAIVPRRGEEEGVVSLTGAVTAPQR